MRVFTSPALASLMNDGAALVDAVGPDSADRIDLWLDRLDTAVTLADLAGIDVIATTAVGEQFVERLSPGVSIVGEVLDEESVRINHLRSQQ